MTEQKAVPIIGIDTSELDRFLAYTEEHLKLDAAARHRFFDELIRLSGNRFSLTKARLDVDRTVDPPTAVIRILPTREIIDNVDYEVDRLRKAGQA